MFAYYQETGDPVAQKYDWGDFFSLCHKDLDEAHIIYWFHDINYLHLAQQDALMKLMAEVCDLIPQSYKDQCDDFIDKYGAEIVEFLLSSAAPHTICTLLHVCWFKEQTVPGQSSPSFDQRLGMNSTPPHTRQVNAALISQTCSSPRTASRVARWLCWADSTWVSTPPTLKHPLSCRLCVPVTPVPSLRSEP